MKMQKKVLATVELPIIDVQIGTTYDEVFITCTDTNGQVGSAVPKAKGRINNTVRVLMRGDQFRRFAVQRGLSDSDIDQKLMVAYLKLGDSNVIVDIEERIHGAVLVDSNDQPVLDDTGNPVVFKGTDGTAIGDKYAQIASPQIILSGEAEEKILNRLEKLAEAQASTAEIKRLTVRPKLSLSGFAPANPAEKKPTEPEPFVAPARLANEKASDYTQRVAVAKQEWEDAQVNNAIGG